jgi:hypothetical protein
MIALIDATMSDLRLNEVDPNALTVFAPDLDDMTEVNLDLAGALESVVEEETRVAPPARAPIPLDFARVELLAPNTVNQRAPASWIEDLLVEEEFGGYGEDDLPMLDSGEFMAAPPIDDLRPPERGSEPGRRSLIAPEPRPIMPTSAPAAYDRTLPVKVVTGSPIIAMYDEKVDLRPDRSLFLWVSAIALGAGTMLAAWAHRMELLGLVGL